MGLRKEALFLSKWRCSQTVSEHERLRGEDNTLAKPLWEGCRESRRCSRDNFPESSILVYEDLHAGAHNLCWGRLLSKKESRARPFSN